MRHALKIMLSVMALLTALYGVRAFLGHEVWGNVYEFMFADYVALWDNHSADLWRRFKGQASREEFRLYVIVAAVIAAVALLMRFITISRNVCAAIAGVFLFYLGVWYLGGGEQPSTRFAFIGTGSLLWMILSSFIRTEEGGFGRLFRRLWRRIKS